MPVQLEQNNFNFMQAAVFTEIKKPLAVQAVPNPLAALGEAVVQLKAAALNHRDLWIQLGRRIARQRCPRRANRECEIVILGRGD